MTFHPYGENALLINFEQRIDTAINEQVIALKQAIIATKLPNITFLIPAYCSLTVGYKAAEMDFKTARLLIEQIIANTSLSIAATPTKKVTIPVCYDAAYALDLATLADAQKMDIQAIIELHTTTLFKVYMLGFLPGFAYMGKLPELLACQRKTTPRVRVPALSVGLAGYQTGIYPSEAPGGWQIIGRTPLPIFDATKEMPFLLKAGDQVQFQAISSRDFHTIAKDIAAGNFSLERL